jgi:Ca2+-binding RTX toxin-like protein
VLGSNFDDVLLGGTGSDTLSGGLGNDLLRGGPGADNINGGAGADRIDFDSPADGVDTISGFATGAGGDVLDIADLLSWTSYANGLGGDLSNFVRFENVTGGSQLQVDTDGAGPTGWQGVATLEGHVDLVLDTLVTDGNLDTMI